MSTKKDKKGEFDNITTNDLCVKCYTKLNKLFVGNDTCLGKTKIKKDLDVDGNTTLQKNSCK